MDTTAKAQMPIRLALDIETIRIRKLGLITIGRTEPGNDRLTSFDPLTTNGRLSCSETRHGLDWRVIAQRLFDCAGHEGAIGTQTLHYAGILIQTQEQVTNQIGRGFVARDEQQSAEP